jgi:hypothetical protein
MSITETTKQPQVGQSELTDGLEAAPPNNLPCWSECKLRVDNSDFIDKRVAEGGYGPDADSLLATQLHRFIYEYDDADPYRSAWFLHRLELVLKEAKLEASNEKLRGVPLTNAKRNPKA